MMRLIIPIILMAVGGGMFFAYTDPQYQEVKTLQAEVASYDTALKNIDQLEKTKEDILKVYNQIPEENIEKLTKLLPDNVDNIRLVLEIESVAAKYGMTLKDVTFEVEKDKGQNGAKVVTENNQEAALAQKDYGIFDLSFSTKGTYPNFVAFTTEIEKSLRIVDMKSVAFLSPEANPIQSFGQPKDVFEYDIDLRTYYLKN